MLPAISRQFKDDLLFPRNRYSAFLQYRNAGRRWEAKVFEGRFFGFVEPKVSQTSVCVTLTLTRLGAQGRVHCYIFQNA